MALRVRMPVASVAVVLAVGRSPAVSAVTVALLAFVEPASKRDKVTSCETYSTPLTYRWNAVRWLSAVGAIRLSIVGGLSRWKHNLLTGVDRIRAIAGVGRTGCRGVDRRSVRHRWRWYLRGHLVDHLILIRCYVNWLLILWLLEMAVGKN